MKIRAMVRLASRLAEFPGIKATPGLVCYSMSLGDLRTSTPLAG